MQQGKEQAEQYTGWSYGAQGYSEGGYGDGGCKAMGQGPTYRTDNGHQPHGQYGQFESGHAQAQSKGVPQHREGHTQQIKGNGGRHGQAEGQRDSKAHVERQDDGGPSSLPSVSSAVAPSFHHQHSVGSQQMTQSDTSFTQHPRNVKMREQRRLGDDILTPGISTEVYNVASGVSKKHEVQESHKVTNVPYDPNLTCVTCGKVF